MPIAQSGEISTRQHGPRNSGMVRLEMETTNLLFRTQKSYVDRASKSAYVYDKYGPILSGNILDVGADEQHLKRHLGPNVSYTGIGLGGTPDIQVNLETERIPFEDGHFDCVLCLDVLEHIDQTHVAFDELCRVTGRYIIISLPNPWRDAFVAMRGRHYRPDQPIKFYGLPVAPPEDRHKWFFSPAESDQFVTMRGKQNGFRLVQVDRESSDDMLTTVQALRRKLASAAFGLIGLDLRPLVTGNNWYVLERI